MKKIYLLIISVFVILSLFSQSYTPFDTLNAEWTCRTGGNHGGIYSNYIWSYINYGDTTINGVSYKKIYSNRYTSNYSYDFAIREDSLKNIWVYDLDDWGAVDTIESLLYSFDIEVGDTVYLTLPNATKTFSVIDTLTTLLNGIYRKTYEVIRLPNGYGFEYWIEGVGSSRGLLASYYYDFESFDMLACYNRYENPYFMCYTSYYYDQDPWYDGTGMVYSYFSCPCWYNEYVSINEMVIKSKPSIFPNPTTGKIFVQADGVEKIEIMDIDGRQVYTGKETEIDISNNPKGIYLIKIQTAERVRVEKVILN